MCCCSCNSTICSPTTAPEHALLYRTVFSVRRWNEHNVGWRFASVWCYRRCNYAIVFFFLLPMWISLLANWRCANYVIFHRLLFDEMKDSRFFFLSAVRSSNDSDECGIARFIEDNPDVPQNWNANRIPYIWNEPSIHPVGDNRAARIHNPITSFDHSASYLVYGMSP